MGNLVVFKKDRSSIVKTISDKSNQVTLQKKANELFSCIEGDEIDIIGIQIKTKKTIFERHKNNIRHIYFWVHFHKELINIVNEWDYDFWLMYFPDLEEEDVDILMNESSKNQAVYLMENLNIVDLYNLIYDIDEDEFLNEEDID